MLACWPVFHKIHSNLDQNNPIFSLSLAVALADTYKNTYEALAVPMRNQFCKWQTQWDTVGLILVLPLVLSFLLMVLSPSILFIFQVIVWERFWEEIKLYLLSFKVLRCLCCIHTARHLADMTKDSCLVGGVAGARENVTLDVCHWVSLIFLGYTNSSN